VKIDSTLKLMIKMTIVKKLKNPASYSALPNNSWHCV